MDHLRNESYYSNLYDLFTIKECLRIEKRFPKPSKSLQKTKAPEKDKLRAESVACNLLLYETKGERYRHKGERIRQWMEGDRLRDEKLADTSPPSAVYCDYCDEAMDVFEKHLHDIEIDKLRVLFFFECPNCNRRKVLFEDGEEFSYVARCPKCQGEIQSKDSRKGKVITTLYSCSNCGYKKKEVVDLDKNRERERREKETDRRLLEKYRNKYCLSDKEGQEYVAEVERLKILVAMIKEQEEKQKDPAYKKAKKLKKLKVVELEKLLRRVLERGKYTNLQFDKPQIGRFVIIPFTVQDADAKRGEYDSQNNLKKLIKKSLEKTNWKLMSEGINYRLGYLSGRLKGYEGEEDLASLVRRNL